MYHTLPPTALCCHGENKQPNRASWKKLNKLFVASFKLPLLMLDVQPHHEAQKQPHFSSSGRMNSEGHWKQWQISGQFGVPISQLGCCLWRIWCCCPDGLAVWLTLKSVGLNRNSVDLYLFFLFVLFCHFYCLWDIHLFSMPRHNRGCDI